MLATGGSVKMCIDVLIKAGCAEKNIMFVNVVSCPEGIAALNAAYPLVKLVTAAVDDGLDENKYILPGLGDFGDRYYRTHD
jgi:uracil phosphoribosyltransferase